MQSIYRPVNFAKPLSALFILTMLALAGSSVSGNAAAQQLSTEAELEKIYSSKIVAFWNQRGERRDFAGVHGVNIAAMIFPNPGKKEGIVIASGYGESFIKYREIIYDLWHQGFQVYILDHRGQGLSGRLLSRPSSAPADLLADKRLHDMGYVDDFENFVADLKTFVDREAKASNTHLFLLGHSMGGAIASLYLEKYSFDFAAAALSAPMHQPDLSPIPNQACWLLRLGPGKGYVWGHGPYHSRAFRSDSELTNSRVRYGILKRGELDRHPQAQLGGPSFHWAHEACLAANRSVVQANQIKVDVLLFQAGQDRIVKSDGQRRFCAVMNATQIQSCFLHHVEGARHELLIEEDRYRNRVLKDMISFFRKRREHAR